MAVGISLLSCVQAKVYVFEVLRPPFWIFHWLHLADSPVVPLEWPSSKLGVAVGSLFLSRLEVEICLG